MVCACVVEKKRSFNTDFLLFTLQNDLGKLGDETVKLGDEAPVRAPAGPSSTPLKNPLGPPSLGRAVWGIVCLMMIY